MEWILAIFVCTLIVNLGSGEIKIRRADDVQPQTTSTTSAAFHTWLQTEDLQVMSAARESSDNRTSEQMLPIVNDGSGPIQPSPPIAPLNFTLVDNTTCTKFACPPGISQRQGFARRLLRLQFADCKKWGDGVAALECATLMCCQVSQRPPFQAVASTPTSGASTAYDLTDDLLPVPASSITSLQAQFNCSSIACPSNAAPDRFTHRELVALDLKAKMAQCQVSVTTQ